MTIDTFDLSRYRRLEDEDAAIHPALDFSDRESYLAWVAAWKTSWHATVAGIRAAKRVRGNKTKSDSVRFEAQRERLLLRVVAYNHLQIRKAAKTKAVQSRATRIADGLLARSSAWTRGQSKNDVKEIPIV